MGSADDVSELDACSWRLAPDTAPMRNALVLARLARLAYVDAFDGPTEGPVEAQADVPGFCAAYPLVRPIHCLRTRGFVAADAENAVVSFAGTHRTDHWSESLRYDQVLDFGGRAHRGFAQALEQVMPSMLAGLYDSDALSKAIWLTGHSLGGGLAILAAWRLHGLGFDLHVVCTFGAPPVLDATAAQAYPVTAWRFANDGDWVPHMQWPRFGSRYAHPGKAFHLLRSGRVAPEHQSPDLARRLDRFQRLDEPRDHGGPFVDHNMKEYIRRIAANLTRDMQP